MKDSIGLNLMEVARNKLGSSALHTRVLFIMGSAAFFQRGAKYFMGHKI